MVKKTGAVEAHCLASAKNATPIVIVGDLEDPLVHVLQRLRHGHLIPLETLNGGHCVVLQGVLAECGAQVCYFGRELYKNERVLREQEPLEVLSEYLQIESVFQQIEGVLEGLLLRYRPEETHDTQVRIHLLNTAEGVIIIGLVQLICEELAELAWLTEHILRRFLKVFAHFSHQVVNLRRDLVATAQCLVHETEIEFIRLYILRASLGVLRESIRFTFLTISSGVHEKLASNPIDRFTNHISLLVANHLKYIFPGVHKAFEPNLRMLVEHSPLNRKEPLLVFVQVGLIQVQRVLNDLPVASRTVRHMLVQEVRSGALQEHWPSRIRRCGHRF